MLLTKKLLFWILNEVLKLKKKILTIQFTVKILIWNIEVYITAGHFSNSKYKKSQEF